MHASDKVTTKVYVFPGQGSDERIFQNLKLDSNFEIVKINYPVPAKGMSMKEYALSLGDQINTKEKYVFIGVSLGGMICTELAEIYHPEKTIIISSAKNRNELPFRYKFMKYFPIYKVIPANVLKAGSFILQPIVEPDRRHGKETFKAMLKDKDPKFLKRTSDMIIRWDKEKNYSQITHIHGTGDHTIPYRKVNPQITVDKGSHMMVFTRSEEINKIIISILYEKSNNL